MPLREAWNEYREAERTHLFSSFFAVELVAAVLGSLAGGALPKLLMLGSVPWRLDLLHAYRHTLLLGAGLAACASLPIARVADAPAPPQDATARPRRGDDFGLLSAIAVNFFMVGAGAGPMIPVTN